MDLKNIVLSTAVAAGTACVYSTDVYSRDGKPRITCVDLEKTQRVCTAHEAFGTVSISYKKSKIDNWLVCVGKEVVGDIWRLLLDYECDGTVDFYRHGDNKNPNIKKVACRTGNEGIFDLFDAELAEIKRDVWREKK